jgi:hypothetical protein
MLVVARCGSQEADTWLALEAYVKEKEFTLEALDTGRHKPVHQDRTEPQGRRGQGAALSTQEFVEMIDENKHNQKVAQVLPEMLTCKPFK